MNREKEMKNNFLEKHNINYFQSLKNTYRILRSVFNVRKEEAFAHYSQAHKTIRGNAYNSNQSLSKYKCILLKC